MGSRHDKRDGISTGGERGTVASEFCFSPSFVLLLSEPGRPFARAAQAFMMMRYTGSFDRAFLDFARKMFLTEGV
jgi:hypothetical protein